MFVSFLAGLAAMARFSLRDGRPGPAAVNIAGAAAVAFTLLVNLARGYPLLSIAATGAMAATLYALWARARAPSRRRRSRTPPRRPRPDARGAR